MAFSRPTLSELVVRIREDLRSRLELDGSVLSRSVVVIIATVWAGAIHLLYGFLAWIARQVFPDTSDKDQLLVQAAPYGMSPNPATYATGTVTATGTNGSPIAEGEKLRRSDGRSYSVTNGGGAIAGGTATLSVEADEPGIDGNCDSGTILTFESTPAGVNAEATVDAPGIDDGNDEEDTEDFRDRFRARLQEPPQGGAEHDYVAWAKEVPGVTRAWVYEHEDASGAQDALGCVTVRFMRDDDPDPFPNAAAVADVQAKLDTERPVGTAEVTAKAPVPHPVDFTVAITPDNAATRAAVNAELADLFKREAEPGKADGSIKIELSHLQVAIGTAEGVNDFTLTTPAADVVPALGQLPTLGTVTFA